MALDILKEKGTPIDRQRFTWRELAGPTYSKLNDDAFTRVRVITMNGIESEALRFSHSCARMTRAPRPILAQVRRIEQHQQTLVNWLNPADQSPLDTTIGFEQQAIEVTAWVAQNEPIPIWPRSSASACSRTSITCIASRRSWTAWKAGTPTR